MVHVLQVGDEVGQAAVDDVDHEHVEADQPDARYAHGFQQPGQADGFATGSAFAAFLEQEPGEQAGADVDHRVEQDRRLQAGFARAHGDEYAQGGEGHQGVDDATAAFEEAEHPSLLGIVAEVADGLEQRRPVDAVGADGEQAEDDQQLAVAGEGGQVQAQGTGADQPEGDQLAGVEAVSQEAADHEQRGGDDGVGAEQGTDLGVGQAHVFLHGHVEGVLQVRQFVDGPAAEDEDQEAEPLGLGLCCHCCSPQFPD
ncbi:hypothetical protein D3C84_620800 [compost metagenome]